MISDYIRDKLINIKAVFEVTLPLWITQVFFRKISKKNHIERILIIASDPSDPSGSMGEMAMLTGLMQSLRNKYADVSFTIIGTRQHHISISGIGAVAVEPAWIGQQGSFAFDRLLRQHDALFALGADVMDGKYGTSLVYRFVGYCNHAARLGLPAIITGFSFNSNPRRPAIHALKKLNKNVRVNIRDQISLNRYQSNVGNNANICADIAFLMKPSENQELVTENWIETKKQSRKVLVGFNVNMHAFSDVINEMGIESFIDKISYHLIDTIRSANIAYVFIPHDTKSKSGDVALLNKIREKIDASNAESVTTFVSSDTAKIKRIAALLDLIVTGRMHLAIASLGTGIPVLSITYQDKFEGLYQHFDLPNDCMISPNQCTTLILPELIKKTIGNLENLRFMINQHLSDVKLLAENNIVINH